MDDQHLRESFDERSAVLGPQPAPEQPAIADQPEERQRANQWREQNRRVTERREMAPEREFAALPQQCESAAPQTSDDDSGNSERHGAQDAVHGAGFGKQPP